MASRSDQTVDSIGDQARRGSVWMGAANTAAKGLGAVTQLALAGIMPREEFGIYATAISLSVFLSVIRDGGLPTVLIQKARRFDFYAGSVFWLMLAINSVTALAIFLAARPAARFYHQPELEPVIELFALTVPLCVPVSLLSLRLTSAMRFAELSIVPAISAVLRNGLLLLFAYRGMGARSFMLSMLIGSAFDALLLWRVTRYSPWLQPARWHIWPRLMRSGRWVLLGTFASALANNGAYFILAKIVSNDVVGTYFFAFQLVTLLGVLLTNSSYQVLLAAFSRINSDPPRLRSAVLRAIGAIALVGSITSLLVAVVFHPMEQILWHGKWDGASAPVLILAVVWPTTAFVNVLYAAQAASGRFKTWGSLAFITAAVSIAGCALGALLGGSASTAAIGYGVGNVVVALITARYSLPSLGIRVRTALSRALRPWAITTGSALVASFLSQRVHNAFLEAIFASACFAGMSYIGLKLAARDSLQLVLDTLRRTFGARFQGRALAATRA